MAVLTEGSGCFDETGDVFLHGDAQPSDSAMVYHPRVIGHKLTQQPHILFDQKKSTFVSFLQIKEMVYFLWIFSSSRHSECLSCN